MFILVGMPKQINAVPGEEQIHNSVTDASVKYTVTFLCWPSLRDRKSYISHNSCKGKGNAVV